jgi:hypothetical protein
MKELTLLTARKLYQLLIIVGFILFISTVFAGDLFAAEVSGIVWYDWDQDGIQQIPPEEVEEGVELTLYRVTETGDIVEVATIVTDATGSYSFTINEETDNGVFPSDFFVANTGQYIPTLENVGDNESIDNDFYPETGIDTTYNVVSENFTLTSVEDVVTDLDFGYMAYSGQGGLCETTETTLDTEFYLDFNHNGQYDPDIDYPGHTIFIFNADIDLSEATGEEIEEGIIAYIQPIIDSNGNLSSDLYVEIGSSTSVDSIDLTTDHYKLAVINYYGDFVEDQQINASIDYLSYYPTSPQNFEFSDYVSTSFLGTEVEFMVTDPIAIGNCDDPDISIQQLFDLYPAEFNIDLGEVEVGTTYTETHTFYNIGDTVVNISEITVSGDVEIIEADVSDCEGAALEADEGCDITLTYIPTSEGNHHIEILLTPEDPYDQELLILVDGNGVITEAEESEGNEEEATEEEESSEDGEVLGEETLAETGSLATTIVPIIGVLDLLGIGAVIKKKNS